MDHGIIHSLASILFLHSRSLKETTSVGDLTSQTIPLDFFLVTMLWNEVRIDEINGLGSWRFD